MDAGAARSGGADMTRLTTRDISDIITDLSRFEKKLVAATGQDLLGVACHGAGRDRHQLEISGLKIGVVPFTCGQGIIGQFSLTVRAIVAHLGFPAFVTDATDAAGIAEAVERSADILFMADDLRYVAINLKQARAIDNGWATGTAFAAALDLAAGGLGNRPVLVLGCGPVGRAAARTFASFGARVSIHDPDTERCRILARDLSIDGFSPPDICPAFPDSATDFPFILDATPVPGIIDTGHITAATRIAAPGVPPGVTPAAAKTLGNRLIYDPLQLGTAAMAVAASA